MTQEIIEKPMSAECTMKQYESIPDSDLVENREYQLTDYPDNGANAEQMAYALTCKRLFPAGTVVTFSGTTDNTYTNGHLYQIQVDTSGTKSWKDITPVSEQSIPVLTGTVEKPILFSNMLTDDIYVLKGYLKLRDNTTQHLDRPFLCQKIWGDKIVIWNALIFFTSGTLQYMPGTMVILDINADVYTTFHNLSTISTLNGSVLTNTGTGKFADFYAPTDPGTTGQILKSNGGNNAPTWIDMPTAEQTIPLITGTTDKPINLATDLEDGKWYLLTGYVHSFSSQTLHLTDSTESKEAFVLTQKDNYSRQCIFKGFEMEGTANGYVNCQCDSIVDIDTQTGNINSYNVTCGISRFNGSMKNKAVTFYAPTSAGTNGQVLQSSGSGEPTWVNLPTSGQIKTVIYDNTTLGDHIADILQYVNVENGGTLLSIGFKTSTISAVTTATKTTITNEANPTVATSSEAVLKPATFYSFRSADINKTGNVTMLILNGPNGLTGCSSTNIEITNDSSTETPTNTCVADGCGQSINADGAVEIITFKGVNLLSIPLEHLVIDYFVV